MGVGRQGIPNPLLHRPNFFQHLIIPESQHTKPGSMKKLRTNAIVCGRGLVLAAIDLDDQHRVQTYKVEDIVAVRMLATEFESAHLAPAQMLP